MPYNYLEYDQFLNSSLSDNNRLLKPFLVDFFKQNKIEKLLDVGCGSGYLPQILKEIKYQNDYIGLDIDKQSIEYNRSLDFGEHYKFIIYDEFSKLTPNNQYDLAIFSLTACEMDDEIVLKYFKTINAKQFLIINPSTITSFYSYKAYKPILSKILSRFGLKPQWFIKAKIAETSDKFSSRNLGGNPNTKGIMYYRTLGDMLNLAKSQDLVFEKYWNLEYTENTIKTAPISKFEAVLWSK